MVDICDIIEPWEAWAPWDIIDVRDIIDERDIARDIADEDDPSSSTSAVFVEQPARSAASIAAERTEDFFAEGFIEAMKRKRGDYYRRKALTIQLGDYEKINGEAAAVYAPLL